MNTVSRLRNDLEEGVSWRAAVEQLTGHGVSRHCAGGGGPGARASCSSLHQPFGKVFCHPGGQAAIGTSNIAATAAALKFIDDFGLTNRWNPVLQGDEPDGGCVLSAP